MDQVLDPALFLPEPEPAEVHCTIISVDDHVVEPPHLFSEYMSPALRRHGPQLVETPEGHQVWEFEGNTYSQVGMNAVAGRRPETVRLEPFRFDQMRPGCYDVDARIADMDLAGIWAMLNFPSQVTGFCGRVFADADDAAVGIDAMRAWNDWLYTEWYAPHPDRIVPCGITFLSDPTEAAREIHRNAERGCHAVCFSEIAPNLGLPSIHTGYWDPFFAACAETQTVVCMHIGSSSKMPAASPDAPPAVAASLSFNNAIASLSDFLFSGVLVRFPELVLAYSEGQIGWIPYILERADDVWKEHRAWGGVADIIPEPPSTYYYRQVYGCCTRYDRMLFAPWKPLKQILP